MLNNPAKRHKAVGFTPKQFHDLFLPSPAAAIRCTIAGLVWSGVPLFTELPRAKVFSESPLTHEG
jgi:hypothetical protein